MRFPNVDTSIKFLFYVGNEGHSNRQEQNRRRS